MLRSRLISELITSDSGLAPEQIVFALLGGEASSRIANWFFRARSEPLPDEYVAEGGDSDDDEEDPDVERSCDSELVMKWGCLRIASFLSLVIRARAPIIRTLRGPSGSTDQFSASGQRPAGSGTYRGGF